MSQIKPRLKLRAPSAIAEIEQQLGLDQLGIFARYNGPAIIDPQDPDPLDRRWKSIWAGSTKPLRSRLAKLGSTAVDAMESQSPPWGRCPGMAEGG
ncbi:hypothetical protein, partial [Mesorhizobium sp.]|uniref:hypothetical protein n=1 Tax=Mesorhizobium sp. TaxID=1871066 RepID=UPI0025BCA540